MRRPVLLFILIAVIVLLLGTTGVFYQRAEKTGQMLQKSQADYAALQADEQETRQRYGQAIDEIAAIQDSLNTIALGEEGAKQLETQLNAEKSLSQTGGDKAMARIATIKAGIERAKVRIQELDKRLKDSGVKVAGLQKMVEGLKVQIADREAQIGQLTERVNVLQTQVADLNTQVEQKDQTIQDQQVTLEDNRREMGTIFYTIGTKSELKNAGLIEGKGGVLGIGKTYRPTGNVDESRFTSMDTDQETVIQIPSEKARVLTNQPLGSYELQTVGQQMELRILDPKAFRTVKHVIIMES